MSNLRYIRQEQVPQIGVAGQARFSAAHVLVVGAGGLAAPALPLLAGAGVGQITIIDPDRVDRSNLHRQHLFTEADQDQPKADAAATRCRAINSDIAVGAITQALTPANAPDLVSGADLVLDCADSFAVSYILSDTCLDANVPLISASALGFGGYVGGFCHSAPSLRAVFPDAPQSGATCAEAGVLGPVVSMIGALQAQMALHHIAGLSPSPLGQMMQLDAQQFRMTGFRFDTAPEPDRLFRFVDPTALTGADTIIDLRSPEESPTPLHPDALRIAPEDLPDLPASADRLALCCATGLRSWRAAESLCDHWPGDIVLLAATAS